MDDPKKHKHPKVVHDKPVPRGGGIPIFAALLTALVFAGTSKQIWGIIAGAAVLAVTGFLDDRFEEKISPYFRLSINVLAAILVIGTGIGIAYITSPFGGVIDLSWPRWCWGGHCIWLLSDIFALVWLVWMQNIVGWSSGVDGQLPGFVIVAAVAMGIMSGAKVGAMLLVLSIPFVDAVLVIIKRLREGRNPVWGGREHLHHSLLDLGWGKRRIAVLYWVASAIMAWAALNLKAASKYFTMATVLVVLAGVILWVQKFSTWSKQPGRGSGSKT